MSNTLYRKYRPQKFADVVGQKHIVKTISNALKNNRLGQAYLFTGPRGTGKTTLARLLAKAVTCSNRKGAEPCLTCPHCLAVARNNSLDIIEIDAASNTGVDNIRELRDSIKLLPTQAIFKVYIIDEVHMLSIGAFNALLKTLEEPPKHVVFILATTSLHKVPETILSRCQRFDFSRLPVDHIIEKLASIAKSEGVAINTPALEMIALAAEGGMRDAESLLAQVISLEDNNITAEEVSSILGITDQQHIDRFLAHIVRKDVQQSILLIHQLVENGSDLYIFTNSLLYSLRHMLLISIDTAFTETLALEITQEHSHNLSACANSLTTSGIVTLIGLFSAARKEIRLASLPQLPLEIAVVTFIMPESSVIANQHANTMPPTRQSPDNNTSVTIKKTLPETTEPPETIPPSNTIPSIHTVKQQWQCILDIVRERNSSLALTLGNCQPLTVNEEGVITLGVKFPIYKDKINATENKLTVESAFDTILESKIRVQVVIDESATPHKSASFSVPANSFLTEAMSILGGKIVA